MTKKHYQRHQYDYLWLMEHVSILDGDTIQ